MSRVENDPAMRRAKLRRSLDNIGKSNGHACPPTQSNIDPVLHELSIAAEGYAYFKTRYDSAKQRALEACVEPGKLEEFATRVTENMQGESMAAATGELYVMTINFSKPAARVDHKALRNYMRIELGIEAADIDKAFAASTDLNAPSKRVVVASR